MGEKTLMQHCARTTRALRRLVRLATKADGESAAISMSEVFDDPKGFV